MSMNWDKQTLLECIVALYDESCMLGENDEAWRRRMEIRTDMVLLCRDFAEMHEGPEPYWAGEEMSDDLPLMGDFASTNGTGKS